MTISELRFQPHLNVNDTKYIFDSKSIGLFTIDIEKEYLDDDGEYEVYYKAEFRRPKARSYEVAGQFDDYDSAYNFLNRIWKDEVEKVYTEITRYVGKGE